MREKNQYLQLLFVSTLFGIIWGVLEVLIISIQGRTYALSETLLPRLGILLSFVVNKMFISFIGGGATCLISMLLNKVKGMQSLLNSRFLHYLFFACYFFAYYTVRLFIQHGYMMSLNYGLAAGLLVLLVMSLAYYFSLYLSDRIIRTSVKLISFIVVCLLLLTIGNSFYHHNEEIIYYQPNDTGFEDFPRNIKPKYNIVFIIVDALRRDHLHTFGYARKNTPFIDEFSKNCVVINNYRTVATATTKSTASLFTGKYPANAGVHSSRFLNEENATIAECLKSIGYKTAYICANVSASQKFAFDQGFSYYRFENSAPASWLYNEFVKVLPELSTAPFFVYLHFMETHTPYIIEESFLKYFMNDDYTKRLPFKFGLHQTASYGGAVGNDPCPDKQYNTQGEYIALYDTSILQFDHYFEKMVQALKQQNVYDNTIIVFSSDHGEFMGEWNIFCAHGGIPYNPQTDVPALIKYNDITLKFDEVMENRNIFKVIVDLIRNEPDTADGIKRILSKYCTGYTMSQRGQSTSYTYGYSIADKDYKYIFNPKGIDIRDVFTFPDCFWPWKVRELLVSDTYYNYLYKDQFYALPNETRICVELPVKRILSESLKKGISISGKEKTDKQKLDDKTKDQLRSLGYVE